MIPLIVAWNGLFGGIPGQSCDFDASRGLVKTWLFLGGAQPLDHILAADGVPETIHGTARCSRALNSPIAVTSQSITSTTP